MTQQSIRRVAVRSLARSGSVLLAALLLALPAAARADSREEISREVHKTLPLKPGSGWRSSTRTGTCAFAASRAAS